jgi:predicted GH43/DUF377 family glycosyl hydrolase
MQLTRHAINPIMSPKAHHAWEALNVFNCSVIYHNELFHMHYRAQGKDMISRIGYAVSADGHKWNRLEDPVVSPHMGEDDYRGVEDPRVTQIDGTFYMTYTAFGANDWFPMIAQSDNLITWKDVGPLERAKNKDHVLFPEKINGRYTILHRRPSSIWIGYSDDLKTWDNHRVLMSPNHETDWDAHSVGANGVPIKTEHGWILFYHGYGEKHIYRQSIALLDLDDPTKIINRPKAFIMEPKEQWEMEGDVPNVIFSCANLVVGDQLHFYYGGADRVIGLATAAFADVVDFARFGK